MNPVRQALYAALAADATLTGMLDAPTGIFHAVAPQNAGTPFVTLQKQAGTPDWQFGGEHIQSELWTIKAVDRATSATRAEDVAARIDVLLNDADLTIAGRDLLAIYRESDVEYTETADGGTYFHVGAMYRIQTAPAADAPGGPFPLYADTVLAANTSLVAAGVA